MKRRFLTGIITAGLVLSMATPAFATELTIKEIINNQQTSIIENVNVEKVTSFSDVPTFHWGYKDIMNMTQKGLFSGTKTPTNGVGYFDTTGPMTRGAFVTVVMRALYNDELSKMPSSGGQWWENSYDLAVEKGILKSNELENGAMDKGMSRQEMALVLVRATEQLGQYPSQLVSTGKIADYNTVGTYYKDSVVKAYSMGMLAGTDAKGTYSPTKTMTRAEGATVLNRLIDVSSRQKVDFSTSSETVTGAITIKEGEQSMRRLAKAGDTVIKADGTKVVLKVGPNGVLGEGQGVAPDLGLISTNGHHTVKDSMDEMFGYDMGKDSTGTNVKQSRYYTNELTGEGHWSKEWSTILQASKPTSAGTKDMELSMDKNWVWVDAYQEWATVPGHGYFK